MSPGNELQSVSNAEIEPLIRRTVLRVREDILDNPYIQEALRVLPVGGYRSAIGSFWNAVVDDLRNKIIHRSLPLFNKAVPQRREIKTYEDFQNLVNDDDLIEGAYKIGVIGWEASKVLRHAKETRHIFDGHPKSTEPSIIKVLAMMDDCQKYVLTEPYPPQIVDIDEYITTMGTASYDRNEFATANALSELPEVYKSELINRLYTTYIHPNTPTNLNANIEFATPILWKVLPKDLKIQVVRRVDQELNKGDLDRTTRAFAFVNLVGANSYLTPSARSYILQPFVTKLRDNLDVWAVENECVRALEPYAANIPHNLIAEYVSAITHTYIGVMGGSAQYSRRDFYANGAALIIPKMFEKFDDFSSIAFVDCVRSSPKLKSRIETPAKFARLRALGNIVLERISDSFSQRSFLEAMLDDARIEEFHLALRS